LLGGGLFFAKIAQDQKNDNCHHRNHRNVKNHFHINLSPAHYCP